MINRRNFLKLGAGAAAGLFLPVRLENFLKTYLYIPASNLQTILPPASIPKYEDACVIPPAMPRVSEITLPDGSMADYYEIAVRQFQQQVLPVGLPGTTVWSFGSDADPATFNYPGFTIEATVDKSVRVKWINGLVNESGQFLPHLLPVDPTLHWANPPGPVDSEENTSHSYSGPVPMVVHVHGAHTTEDSDGFPEAWYLPNANNIPAGYFQGGTYYQQFKEEFSKRWGVTWEPGSAVFQYPNDMRALTSWFHDHVLGITRLNVYAGPAAFYILRGGPSDDVNGVLPGPAPALGDAPGTKYYEIPLAIQDRTFNDDGSLFYPDNRAFFEGLEPSQLQFPFKPAEACDGETSDVAPIWNPEFFGNTMVVNGKTWPYLEVEKRRYRFRLLNGCNSRFLILKLVGSNPGGTDFDPVAAPAVRPFWVIGNEGGFLPEPVSLNELLIAPAERYDVIVDFTTVPPDTKIFMINLGPDEPFGGGVPGTDFDVADRFSTGSVMQFRVVDIVGTDPSTPPDQLELPAITPLGPAEKIRRLSLVELDSSTVRVVTDEAENIVLACDDPEAAPFGPTEAHLGVVNFPDEVIDLGWDEPITEIIGFHHTELWEFFNFTVDAHPIHVHQVHFEVVSRQTLKTDSDGAVILPIEFTDQPQPPAPEEAGFKDTVIALPGQVTRIKAKFDIPGLFVWHCHILEHEDNEMMRPFQVEESKIYMPIIGRNGVFGE